MSEFIEIACLTEEEQDKIRRKIDEIVAGKLKDGLFTEKEIREISEMKLNPLPDIQDVQSVAGAIPFSDDD